MCRVDGPANWEVVAQEIWKDQSARHQLRHKWDVTISRLRRKLRDARVRPDLIHSDGTGAFQLLLHPDDTVEDKT